MNSVARCFFVNGDHYDTLDWLSIVFEMKFDLNWREYSRWSKIIVVSIDWWILMTDDEQSVPPTTTNDK